MKSCIVVESDFVADVVLSVVLVVVVLVGPSHQSTVERLLPRETHQLGSTVREFLISL